MSGRRVLTGTGISPIPYAVHALFMMAMSAELLGVPPQSIFDPALVRVEDGQPVTGARR